MSDKTEKDIEEKVDHNSSPDEIVTFYLNRTNGLESMKPIFIHLIETLKDNILRPEVCQAAIVLLKSRACFERIVKLIRSYATDKDLIPCSLRVKSELVPTMKSLVRKQEFQTIREVIMIGYESY